jgi:hypothetical protein
MKQGTKSVLFGVHQFIWHPITVYLAWVDIYRKLPSFWETVAIVVHDWGYWGKAKMDDAEGEMHPVFGAKLIRAMRFFFFGSHEQANNIAFLVAFHSRYLAARFGVEPSKLCWPDKLCMKYDPSWFYLLRARLSGELAEYRLNAVQHIPLSESNRSWFKWIRAKCILVALNKTLGQARVNP